MIMALRASLKVPKYGLFYFPIDQTTSIVPVKNIQQVVDGDNKTKGSKVRVQFDRQVVEAEIIGVNDDDSKLREIQTTFEKDPANAHLFKKKDEEERQPSDKIRVPKKRKQPATDDKTRVEKTKKTKESEQLHQSEECQASPANLGKCGTGGIPQVKGHVGNCGFGICQGKEMGQAEGYERCSPFEASGGEDLRTIPCVHPECDVVLKSRIDLAEHLKNECLYRLEVCRSSNEQVDHNTMKLHQSEECQASPAKLEKSGKGGIPQVKKEQLNVNQLLQRQVLLLLSGSIASKIKKSRENNLDFNGEIAPTPKEVTSGNSDTRNICSRNSGTDQQEQTFNDLKNRVAQHDLEFSRLWQSIRHLSGAFRDVSTKVDQVRHTLDCQKRDFDAFQGNLTVLKNEQINLQARFNRLLESPLQHGELARCNRSMEVIQERIARLERYSRSHGGMLANMADKLTDLANAARDGRILGVIQRV